MELWLKRYLSLFFNSEHYGNLTWLAIPLIVYFVVTIKKRKRFEIAIAFVLVLSCIAIGISGRSNFRYILTLYPFTLGVIFLFSWEFIKRKSRYLQIAILVICAITVFINFYHYRESYKFYWRYKVIAVDDYFPHDLLKFINNIGDLNSDSTFLVCSQRNLFYYYTNKKGIHYRDPRMRIFKRQKNKEAALDIIRNQLNIKYILLHRNFNPTKMLRNIISNDCDLAYQDRYELSLYRIREKKLDNVIKKRDLNIVNLKNIFVNDSLLRNGSFENWTKGPFKTPDFFEGADHIFREEKEIKVGKYSVKIIGDNFNFFQNLPDFEDYRGKKITCFAWIKTSVPNKYRIQIYDGIDFSFSLKHLGKDRWELLQANHTINPHAKFVRVRVIQAAKTGKIDDVVYIDGVLLVEGYLNISDLYSLHMKKGK